jgi:hypothetical protein
LAAITGSRGLMLLIPSPELLFPRIGKADEQFGQEHHHGDPSGPASFFQADGPGKQEGCFQVEDDEEDRYQIEADVKLAAGSSKVGNRTHIPKACQPPACESL